MTDSLLLSPGPVQVPERARQAMARALIHHRTPAFKELFLEVQQGLQWVFQTENPLLTLTCSGTGAFEAAMINFSRRGDTVLAIGGGKFGERWSGVGRAYGLNVVDVPVVWGNAVDLDLLGDLLEQHPEASMVTVSLSETSTGVLHPIEQLVEAGELIRIRGNRYGLADRMQLVVGHLLVNPRGFGFVTPEHAAEGARQDIFVAGVNLHQAMHGDRVAIRLEQTPGRPEGRIVRVLERAREEVRVEAQGEADALGAGDALVVRGNDRLRPGQPVQVVE